MIDIVCRVVTIIVLCVILLRLVDYAHTRSQKLKREKQDKELVKDFILQFLASHQEDGTTRYMLEKSLAEVKKDGNVIFGCLVYSVEILRQLAIDGMITVKHVSVTKCMSLEKWPTKDYDYNLKWAVQQEENVKRVSFCSASSLIQLTPKGRSFVSAYQTK